MHAVTRQVSRDSGGPGITLLWIREGETLISLEWFSYIDRLINDSFVTIAELRWTKHFKGLFVYV